MDLKDSILETVRAGVGLSYDNPDFDADILIHINGAIAKLNQNGVGNFLVVSNDTSTWEDLQDPTQTAGNLYFQYVPLFVTLSTKLLFDPPPPSLVSYYSTNINEALWRLKVAYEKPYEESTTTGSDCYE